MTESFGGCEAAHNAVRKPPVSRRSRKRRRRRESPTWSRPETQVRPDVTTSARRWQPVRSASVFWLRRLSRWRLAAPCSMKTATTAPTGIRTIRLHWLPPNPTSLKTCGMKLALLSVPGRPRHCGNVAAGPACSSANRRGRRALQEFQATVSVISPTYRSRLRVMILTCCALRHPAEPATSSECRERRRRRPRLQESWHSSFRKPDRARDSRITSSMVWRTQRRSPAATVRRQLAFLPAHASSTT